MGQYAVILVPSNPDVRNLLQGNDIDFTFVLPEKTDSFRERLRKLYVGRSNNQAMIDAVMGYFDTWSRNPVDYDYGIEVLPEGKYLEDLLLDMGLVKG